LSASRHNQLWVFHHRLYRDRYIDAFQLTALKHQKHTTVSTTAFTCQYNMFPAKGICSNWKGKDSGILTAFLLYKGHCLNLIFIFRLQILPCLRHIANDIGWSFVSMPCELSTLVKNELLLTLLTCHMTLFHHMHSVIVKVTIHPTTNTDNWHSINITYCQLVTVENARISYLAFIVLWELDQSTDPVAYTGTLVEQKRYYLVITWNFQ